MAQPIGYAFAPTPENARERGRGTPDQSQRSIQTLSFSLPSFAGAVRKKGLSPLQGQEYAGSPISQAVLQSVLRTVLGAEGAASVNTGAPAVSQQPIGVPGASGGEVSQDWIQQLMQSQSRTPAPVIHPGDGGDRRQADGVEVITPGPGYDPPVFDRTQPPADVPVFDRTTAPSGPGVPSPFADWADDERRFGGRKGWSGAQVPNLVG